MKRKQYLFRADGNARIGAGHLMRCLTIARALSERLGSPEQILFLCADEASGELAASYGFLVHVLHTDFQRMEEELPLWEALLQEKEDLPGGDKSERGQRKIVVDSYYVTDVYLQNVARWGEVFLLDDMHSRPFPVDAVINYNIFADQRSYERLYEGRNTKLYLGSCYVPLRPQFRNRNCRVSAKVRSVLITTGGGDRENIAGKVLDCIYRKGIHFHITAGSFSPNFSALKKLEEKRKGVIIHHNVQDMAGLMEQCDLAVTAAGTTVYELCAVGVPFLCFSYAENQEELAAYLGNHGIAVNAGAFHRDALGVLERLGEEFGHLCDDVQARASLRERIRAVADGQGADRLAWILAQ